MSLPYTARVQCTLLAITDGDRLLAGLLALVLCLMALVLWLFPIILLGRAWRGMTRLRRTRAMRGMIAVMFLLTAALLIGVPHVRYDIEDDPASDDGIYIVDHAIGVTSWFVRREEDRTVMGAFSRGLPVAPTMIERSEISLIGVFALLPALAAMWLIARWLWREMPGFYRRPDSRCDWCDYDLRGSPSPVCPECGETVE